MKINELLQGILMITFIILIILFVVIVMRSIDLSNDCENKCEELDALGYELNSQDSKTLCMCIFEDGIKSFKMES